MDETAWLHIANSWEAIQLARPSTVSAGREYMKDKLPLLDTRLAARYPAVYPEGRIIPGNGRIVKERR